MMAIWFYRLFIAPVMTLGLVLLSPFHKKLRAAFNAKRRPWPTISFAEKPIWIHAASGEFEYAKPVIRELKNRHPQIPIVVTYSSTSFVRQIEKFPGVDLILPLPLDLPGPTSALIKKLNPRAFLLARTDFWPELLTQLRRLNIPATVFSYTQKHPRQLSFLSRRLRRWVLSGFSQIACVSPDDLTHLRTMGVQHGEIVGDTRYDQVSFRLAHGTPLPEVLKPEGQTLIAGSTWPEDERILIPALASLLRGGRLKLILTPHEPNPAHIEALQDQLRRQELTFRLFSERASWADRQVLIVDQVGVLAELYQWGTFAFVGGSFRGSVHSVMEALGAGLPTLVGPYIQNNREAMEFSKLKLTGGFAVQIVNDTDSLTARAEKLLSGDHPSRNTVLQTFAARQGAAKKVCDFIVGP